MSEHDKEIGGPEPVYDKIVEGYEVFEHEAEFACQLGGSLPGFRIAYETWGELNDDRSNAVLIHTGLSASSHARSHAKNERPGWWEKFIGPGCPLDTDRFFFTCSNLLGGCYGSTGPSSPAADGKPWGPRFPFLTVQDMVVAQFLLLDHLGIDRLHASVGASLGGMQSLQAAALEPERVGRVVSISAAATSHAQSIAMRHVQRSALLADPAWNGGDYYDGPFPHAGMKVAREIGTITYRSGPEWNDRFGRKRVEGSEPGFGLHFQVESYLDHQGEKFCLQYDPNSYLAISRAMDLFDLGEGHGGLEAGVARIQCPSLVIGVRSDILFPYWQQRQLADLLELGGADTTYLEIDAPYGHDTFLIELEAVGEPVRRFLQG
ncbi:MAG: homoserine O-acetyltransferase [Acidobacteriota bacterium]